MPYAVGIDLFNFNAIGVSEVPMPENSPDQIMGESVIASRVRYILRPWKRVRKSERT